MHQPPASADAHSAGHDAAHHHAHDDGAQVHFSLRGYLVGFVLSVVLTAIPFWLVMGEVLESRQLTGFIVMGFAAVQIVVHMVFFLHMDTRSEQGWIMMALIFTLIVVVITLSGSLWVMHHLNTNTMPFHDMQRMR